MTLRLTLCLFLFFILRAVNATHLRSGEISVRQEKINSLTVKITVTVYTNTINTDVLFGGYDDGLDLGDGTIIKIPETPNTPRPDLGQGIAVATFVIYHTYAQMGKYVISYAEPNRNAGVINMDNSVSTRFYLETMIVLQPDVLFRTPITQAPQAYFAGTGSEFTLSLACTDSVGNRLRYEKTVPKMSKDEVVANYRYPEAYSVNQYSGLVTWDTKFQQAEITGEYAFAVKINQVATSGKIVGYMVRDFQIILDDTTSPKIKDTKDLDEDNRIYVPPSQNFTVQIVADTSDRTETNLYAYSELSKNNEAFQFSTQDSISTTTGEMLKVGTLQLRNVTAVRRDAPYVITIRAVKNYGSTLFTKDISYLFFTNDVPTRVDVIPDPEPEPEPEPDPVTSIEAERAQSPKVYPNPFVDYFTIESDFSSKSIVTLRDSQGRIVCERALSEKVFDGSKLRRGVYFLMLRDEGKKSVIKVVRE